MLQTATSRLTYESSQLTEKDYKAYTTWALYYKQSMCKKSIHTHTHTHTSACTHTYSPKRQTPCRCSIKGPGVHGISLFELFFSSLAHFYSWGCCPSLSFLSIFLPFYSFSFCVCLCVCASVYGSVMCECRCPQR